MGNKKKVIENLLYNIIATSIPLIVLQVLLLPALSRYLSPNEYGLSITLVALMNICPGVLGISLNNIRLLQNTPKLESREQFNSILIEIVFINMLLVFFTSIYYEKSINHSTVLTIILSIFWLLREYYIVEFQIELEFNKIFLNNIVVSIGYLFGFIFFYYIKIWQAVYLFGYILGLFQIIVSKKIYRFVIFNNSNVYKLKRDVYVLSLSALLIRISTYADRLILYPILGGYKVSIYYSATIVAKLISMAINPISSVLLSHLSKLKVRPKKKLNYIFFAVLIFCCIGYFVVIIFSKYALNFLYPTFAKEAIKLVPYTSLSTILYIMISLLNPIILKYFEIKWQFILNFFNTIIYFFSSMYGLRIAGLSGFCIGICVVNALKLLTMLLLYYCGNIKKSMIDI